MTNQPAYYAQHRVRFEFRKSRAVASDRGRSEYTQPFSQIYKAP